MLELYRKLKDKVSAVTVIIDFRILVIANPVLGDEAICYGLLQKHSFLRNDVKKHLELEGIK